MTTQTVKAQMVEESKAINYTLWTLQVLAAAMFTLAGYSKLSGDPQMVGLFNAIGIGQWFRYLTGGIELVSAILLIVPRLSGVGALLLVPTMIGALLTHAFIVGGSFGPALVLFIVTSVIAYGRKNRTLQLLKR